MSATRMTGSLLDAPLSSRPSWIRDSVPVPSPPAPTARSWRSPGKGFRFTSRWNGMTGWSRGTSAGSAAGLAPRCRLHPPDRTHGEIPALGPRRIPHFPQRPRAFLHAHPRGLRPGGGGAFDVDSDEPRLWTRLGCDCGSRPIACPPRGKAPPPLGAIWTAAASASTWAPATTKWRRSWTARRSSARRSPGTPSARPTRNTIIDEIMTALKQAAAHLPRVDAIGGSSAGHLCQQPGQGRLALPRRARERFRERRSSRCSSTSSRPGRHARWRWSTTARSPRWPAPCPWRTTPCSASPWAPARPAAT